MQTRMRSVVVAALTATAACGSDGALTPPPTEENIVGLYDLRSVNGSLPYPVGGDATKVVYIVSGSMDVRADKTFTDVLTTRINYTAGGDPEFQTSSTSGTYVFLGRNLELVYVISRPQLPDTTVYDTVVVTGTQVFQDEGSLQLRYRK